MMERGAICNIMRRILAVISAMFALCLGTASGATVEITNIAGASYIDMPEVMAKFRLPDGFVRSARFSGFEDPERSIETVIALLRAPYDSIADKIDADGLKARNVEVLARADVMINGRRGVLIKAVHQDSGTRWGKWILVLDNRAGTLVVNGVFVSGDTKSAVDIETMLKGIVPYGEIASQTADPKEIIVSSDDAERNDR